MTPLFHRPPDPRSALTESSVINTFRQSGTRCSRPIRIHFLMVLSHTWKNSHAACNVHGLRSSASCFIMTTSYAAMLHDITVTSRRCDLFPVLRTSELPARQRLPELPNLVRDLDAPD